MAFIKKSGKTKIMYLPVAASAGAVAEGSAVALVSGVIVPATNTVDTFSIVGIIRKAIATTDSDYAVARLVPVEVPVEMNVVYEAPVEVGTLVATSVGLYFDLGTSDAGTGIDQSASALDVALCVKFISATKGLFVLNIGALAKVK